MPTCYKKQFTQETEEELLNMSRDEASLELNDKQKLFCEYYTSNHNAILSCKKAGYSVGAAPTLSWKLRQNQNVNRYLAWLKLRVGQECHIKAMDIIDHYARIAFSDITDFASISGKRVMLKDGTMIDGQLVKSVKQGREGVSIELYDKIAALQKLERFFEIMPADWKQKIEEQKLEILKQQLELEKIKAGQYENTNEDDGFIEALRESAISVWENDEDEKDVDDEK